MKIGKPWQINEKNCQMAGFWLELHYSKIGKPDWINFAGAETFFASS